MTVASVTGRGALRASLVAVWLSSGLVSALDVGGRSTRLMADAGLHDPVLAAVALWGGVAGDLGGAALLAWRPGRASYGLAIAWTLLMTLVATLVVPGRWLDPLGPLTKNLPLLAALALLRGERGDVPRRRA